MKTSIQAVYKQIKENGNVLDLGCFGFRQVNIAENLGLHSLNHFGVDFGDCPAQLPKNFVYRKADLSKEKIPFEDDKFDLVVASHIIEHLKDPVDFVAECVRVCRPGGFMYFEAPSERSLLLPGMPFQYDKFFSLSYYDDPTHISRPWTPQAFYRITKYYSCEPLKVGYCISWKQRLLFPLTFVYALLTKNARLLESCCWGTFGWASYLIARKPDNIKGKPELYYYIPPR
jgi:SAM-dependent methyltransferase